MMGGRLMPARLMSLACAPATIVIPGPMQNQLYQFDLGQSLSVQRESTTEGTSVKHPLIYSNPKMNLKSECSRTSSAKRTRSGLRRSGGIAGMDA